MKKSQIKRGDEARLQLDRAYERLGEKSISMTEEELRTYIQLDYLASILVEIYLDEINDKTDNNSE